MRKRLILPATAHIGHQVIDNSVPLGYKVDVRRPDDFAPVVQELRHAIGAAVAARYAGRNRGGDK